MQTNLEIVKGMYDNLTARNMEAVKQVFDDQIEWKQMDGFPSGGHHVGFDAIIKNVFQHFDTHWTGWKTVVTELLDAGDNILAVGYYSGTFNTTGKSFKADFMHRSELKDGKIVKFTQYTDTYLVAQAVS